mmetsp:Transcript_16010/g.32769  ORF Transcript_16010/g.32769 Transcript_16010/m.32769 type:complete len:135 (-) Transcript_16010:394-798(-)
MELKNCTQTNDDLLFEVSPFLSCLRVLNLWGCVQVTNAGVAALAEHCKRLEFLTLAGCLQITDKGIMSFADSCTTLTMIDLNGCPNITSSSVRALAWKNPGIDITPPYLRSVPQGEEVDPEKDIRDQLLTRAFR